MNSSQPAAPGRGGDGAALRRPGPRGPAPPPEHGRDAVQSARHAGALSGRGGAGEDQPVAALTCGSGAAVLPDPRRRPFGAGPAPPRASPAAIPQMLARGWCPGDASARVVPDAVNTARTSAGSPSGRWSGSMPAPPGSSPSAGSGRAPRPSRTCRPAARRCAARSRRARAPSG